MRCRWIHPGCWGRWSLEKWTWVLSVPEVIKFLYGWEQQNRCQILKERLTEKWKMSDSAASTGWGQARISRQLEPVVLSLLGCYVFLQVFRLYYCSCARGALPDCCIWLLRLQQYFLQSCKTVVESSCELKAEPVSVGPCVLCYWYDAPEAQSLFCLCLNFSVSCNPPKLLKYDCKISLN